MRAVSAVQPAIRRVLGGRIRSTAGLFLAKKIRRAWRDAPDSPTSRENRSWWPEPGGGPGRELGSSPTESRLGVATIVPQAQRTPRELDHTVRLSGARRIKRIVSIISQCHFHRPSHARTAAIAGGCRVQLVARTDRARSSASVPQDQGKRRPDAAVRRLPSAAGLPG